VRFVVNKAIWFLFSVSFHQLSIIIFIYNPLLRKEKAGEARDLQIKQAIPSVNRKHWEIESLGGFFWSSDYKVKAFSNLATGYRRWFLQPLWLKYFPFGIENFVAGKQKTVLRTCGWKRENDTTGWKKFHNEELYNRQPTLYRLLIKAKVFSSPDCPNRLWGQPSLLLNGHRRFFPWPGREADHSPTSRAEAQH